MNDTDPTFYVTFGQRYATEPHPTFPEAHPDGVVAIRANSIDLARDMVVEAFGQAWSSLEYMDSRLTEWYPRGVVAYLDCEIEPIVGDEDMWPTTVDGQVTVTIVCSRCGGGLQSSNHYYAFEEADMASETARFDVVDSAVENGWRLTDDEVICPKHPIGVKVVLAP